MAKHHNLLIWPIAGLALMATGCDKLPSGMGDKGGNSSAEAGAAVRPADIAQALSAQDIGRATDLARQYVAINVEDPEGYVLLARAEALGGNNGSAASAFQSAIDKGLTDPRGALNHPDFDKARATEPFAALVRKLTAGGKAGGSVTPHSTVRAGDVSISETGGHSRIRAGDIVIDEDM